MRERRVAPSRPGAKPAQILPPFFRPGLVLAALLAWPGPTLATNVGGAITANTTWTLAGSPYVAASTVSVQNDAVLTIQPWVTVKFAPGALLEIGSTSSGGGTLVADAAAGSAITFTSSQPSPAPGDWAGMKTFSNTVHPVYSGGSYVSGTILRNCVIEYAGGASVTTAFTFSPFCPALIDCMFRHNRAATYLVYGGTAGLDSVLMTRCTFTDNNAGAGNVLTTRNAHLDHCRFTGNSGNSVLVSSGGTCVLDNTVIADNSGSKTGIQMHISGRMILRCSVVSRNGMGSGYGGIYVNADAGSCTLGVSQSIIQDNVPKSVMVYGNTHSVDLTGNWWGTTDTTAISNSIHDCRDDAGRSCAWFAPILATATPCALTPARPLTWGRLRRSYR